MREGVRNDIRWFREGGGLPGTRSLLSRQGNGAWFYNKGYLQTAVLLSTSLSY